MSPLSPLWFDFEWCGEGDLNPHAREGNSS
jgi:hypothetical protein